MGDLTITSPHARPFARWDEEPSPGLPEHGLAWLAERIGPPSPSAVTPPAELQLADPKLPDDARAALVEIVGGPNVRSDRMARLRHSAGSSLDDLLRQRSGEALGAPDAVVSPAAEGEVVRILAAANAHRLAVIPVGGGTSVVGGVEPVTGVGHQGVIAVDTSRMRGLLAASAEDRTARFLPGTTGPEAERLLSAHGLTLGHVPQSFARATIGGYAATRSAGQASAGFGRFDSMVVALRMATPRGVLAVGTGTPNAAGPDLRQLVIGSEGAFGIITEVTVRVRRPGAQSRYEGWMFPDLASGLRLLRAFAQDSYRADTAPDVCRLSDPQETELQLALRGHGPQTKALDGYLRLRGRSQGCLGVFGWEGSPRMIRVRRSEASDLIRRAGGVALGSAAGQAWRRHRFDAPRQRDSLLDAGVLVETLETATRWSNLGATRAAMRHALIESLTSQGTPPIVMSHISHIYPTGACLYFTVMARMAGEPGREGSSAAAARAQWHMAKRAVNEAVVGSGATITHHHGVGRDHAPWLGAEIGGLGLDLLRSVKAGLDPEGVMNPGALVG